MKQDFDDVQVPVKFKLAALWTSVMFLYIYADYFRLYIPGSLKTMQLGVMIPFGPVTQGILLGTSLMMAVPGVMICLSILLKPGFNRLLNIIFGTIYTIIILITMWGWVFYMFYGAIEVALTALIVWYAWRWPAKNV